MTGEWRVEDYIREEVKRQGHNLRVLEDGGYRVQWMREAWEWARTRAADPAPPSIADVEEIARRIEPAKNMDGIRMVRVRVGLVDCPDPEDVPRLLTALLDEWENLDPIEWYRAFELIHPFRDGNGRTGKVLLAWRSNSFDHPYFPPADLFGTPVSNP